ncbi:hypothetical protein Spb1_35200 [Planctopirus ephydatiae]|uniref:Uncharacterized protein n=1 Tax=Planctopirus ephydatiae TaxID=2528019 RepID=A0A518GSL7_9PLAN|nr:hypothetical protein Spb1_35200 [Planctopirus ephydatiae]
MICCIIAYLPCLSPVDKSILTGVDSSRCPNGCRGMEISLLPLNLQEQIISGCDQSRQSLPACYRRPQAAEELPIGRRTGLRYDVPGTENKVRLP